MNNRLFLSMIAVVFLMGCASAQKPTALNQMQIRVNQLERELAKRDREIDELKFQLGDLSAQIEDEDNFSFDDPIEDLPAETYSSNTVFNPAPKTSKDDRIIRVSASAKEVQNALKLAGYYTGSIDGKIGRGSKRAIKDFQKDHGLSVDGIVGKKTWAELAGYLE